MQPDRIGDVGNVSTAGAAAAGTGSVPDICGKFAGKDLREMFRQQTDYRNYPVK